MMTASGSKSTPRRPTTKTSSDRETKDCPTSPKKAPLRRSRSVSAVPRSQLETSSLSSSSDFLIKRDNPLYWSNVSPPDKDDGIVPKNAFTTSQFKDTVSKIAPTCPKASSADNTRGRSVSRNVDTGRNGSGIGKGTGRSRSRVDMGQRGGSASRGPVARGRSVNSESDVEQECRTRNGRGRSTPSNIERPSSPKLSLDDGVLGNSFFEAEERTIKAVCEQMKSFQGHNLEDNSSGHIYETVRSEVRRAIADIQSDLESAIRRSNATSIAIANVTDIPPDLVNPSAIELVLDIRREYANKLEQSQERARKLQADLAVEEHRGLELSRILKEVLPEPKASSVQKSRLGRKSSIERRRMSKRLTEEAMTYFDECVSLSTFDSSDFSSQEDPPINLSGITAPIDDRASFSQTNFSIANCFHNNSPSDQQELDSISSHKAAGRSAASSFCKEPIVSEVGLKPNDTFELHHGIRKYAKSFEREIEVNSPILRSDMYDPDEYKLQASPQSLLSDMMLFKNRIESGGMLLCGAGVAISFSPFVSLI